MATKRLSSGSTGLYLKGRIWYGYYYGLDGKRRRVCTRQRDQEAAAVWLRQRVRDALAAEVTERNAPASAGGVPGGRARTVEDACRYLVEQSKAKDWPASTLKMFADKAGHILRILGPVKLTELTTPAVKRYIDQRLGEKVSAERTTARETVRKELSTLRAALREAEELGWLAVGTHKSVIPTFLARYVPRERWLTPEEFSKLCGALADPTRRKHAHEVAARRRFWITLAVFLGGRLSEIESKIHWDEVDLAASVLRLRGTKTAGSDRAIPIPAPLAAILAEVPQENRVGLVAGPWSSVRRDLAQACERAGIERVTPNDLRRTYASWLVNAGVPLQQVARLLGHKSTRMVDLVYGKLSDATLAAAVAKLPTVQLPELPLPPITSSSGAGDSSVTAPGARMARMARVIPLHPARPASEPDAITSKTAERGVPRDGVEPPTRGFSVPVPEGLKIAPPKAKLRVVK
jgi:integrase